MPLYQADCLLTRVRLLGRSNHYPWDLAQQGLADARRLIDRRYRKTPLRDCLQRLSKNSSPAVRSRSGP